MDYISTLKALIASLQALVALYMAQLAALPQGTNVQVTPVVTPTVQTTTIIPTPAPELIPTPVSSTDSSTPQPILTATVLPASCSVSVIKNSNGSFDASWTSHGTSSSGDLLDNFQGKVDGGVVIYQNIKDNLPPSGTWTDLQYASVYKLIFGDTVCFAYYINRNDDSSVSDRPASWSQLTL